MIKPKVATCSDDLHQDVLCCSCCGKCGEHLHSACGHGHACMKDPVAGGATPSPGPSAATESNGV